MGTYTNVILFQTRRPPTTHWKWEWSKYYVTLCVSLLSPIEPKPPEQSINIAIMKRWRRAPSTQSTSRSAHQVRKTSQQSSLFPSSFTYSTRRSKNNFYRVKKNAELKKKFSALLSFNRRLTTFFIVLHNDIVHISWVSYFPSKKFVCLYTCSFLHRHKKLYINTLVCPHLCFKHIFCSNDKGVNITISLLCRHPRLSRTLFQQEITNKKKIAVQTGLRKKPLEETYQTHTNTQFFQRNPAEHIFKTGSSNKKLLT